MFITDPSITDPTITDNLHKGSVVNVVCYEHGLS